ncbi:hypothetical protein [Bacillus luti]|uniref:hypothetical protein n=1 Tax=Bacillus luti TaxID=2026191 RepID=UPI003D02E054
MKDNIKELIEYGERIPHFPSLPTYRSFYDEEALNLVLEIFTDDFEAYGYMKNEINF